MNDNIKAVFATLNKINVNEHTEKKNGLTYLSWAWAWAEVKKTFPDAYYTIYENGEGWNYYTDGRTCWVKTGVTIEGLEHIEYLPVMDARNRSISADNVTSFDVNKAIQRSLTKACARHGLGLYIYAGEDLPDDDTPKKAPKLKAPTEDDGRLPWEDPADAIDEQTLDELWTLAEDMKLTDAQLAGLLRKYYSKESPEQLTTDEANDFMKRCAEFRAKVGKGC